ncbi:hypothetical protein cypCar_00015699 [Cyprinus carpio]|nr:hypothetical protein cypCar_00015699 [Cyprinus carpio]
MWTNNSPFKKRASALSSSFSDLCLCPGGALARVSRCKTYEDCCGTQCCVRALSGQRIWYFCTGFFIRRRVHPYPPPEGPDFNVAFTRQPITSPGLRQAGFHNYGDSETAVISTVYQVQTHPGHVTAVYSALPSHYRQPPPSYDQVMQDSQKK